MKVAVAIVSYNSADDVAECLEALGRTQYADFEVVVWENAGPAAFERLTADIPTSLPGGQPVQAVLSPGNLGFAGGVNGCIKASPEADAWWVLNPDTIPDVEALGALVRRLAKGDCDAVGGVLYLPDGTIQAYGGFWRKTLARAVSLGYGGPIDAAVDPAEIEQRQNFLNGASMLVGRAFVDATGLMREEYFLYCEEVEWCLRALASGARLGFAADARVLHKGGTSTGNTADFRSRSKMSVYLNERNRLLLTRDCFPGLLPLAILGAAAVLTWRYVRRGAWRQWGYALSGWMAGVAGRRGVPAWAAPAVRTRS